ncbi:MAG TPA: hypothetical protein VG869_11655 [Acidimicrobiia bacterium]|jgi:hypothetical protein|nr:hypothetical protein [Acidimicrobiia bacterium]
MRKTCAVLAAVGLVATLMAALAGPAGAKGSPGGQPPKESKCSSKSQKGIVYSMTQFLTQPTAAGKTAYVQGGSALTTVIDQTFTAAKTAGLVKDTQDDIPAGIAPKCTGKTTASFTYDLQYKDKATGTTQAPLGLHNAGGAVLVKGHWLITAQTVCDLTALLGMAIPNSPYGNQCYQAAGLPVPPPS